MVRAPGRARNATWECPGPIYHRPRRHFPPKPLQMMTRAEWDASPFPVDNPGERLQLPVRHIRYTFTRTPKCRSPEDCIPQIKEMQRDYQSRGQPDLMYNFLVGGDGMIYEGRGWDFKCTGKDYFVNSPGPSINIAYIGTYEETLVPAVMGRSGELIRKWAQHHNLLTRDHEITPTLACFKEGEEDIDHLAENVKSLGLKILFSETTKTETVDDDEGDESGEESDEDGEESDEEEGDESGEEDSEESGEEDGEESDTQGSEDSDTDSDKMGKEIRNLTEDVDEEDEEETEIDDEEEEEEDSDSKEKDSERSDDEVSEASEYDSMEISDEDEDEDEDTDEDEDGSDIDDEDDEDIDDSDDDENDEDDEDDEDDEGSDDESGSSEEFDSEDESEEESD